MGDGRFARGKEDCQSPGSFAPDPLHVIVIFCTRRACFAGIMSLYERTFPAIFFHDVSTYTDVDVLSFFFGHTLSALKMIVIFKLFPSFLDAEYETHLIHHSLPN